MTVNCQQCLIITHENAEEKKGALVPLPACLYNHAKQTTKLMSSFIHMDSDSSTPLGSFCCHAMWFLTSKHDPILSSIQTVLTVTSIHSLATPLGKKKKTKRKSGVRKPKIWGKQTEPASHQPRSTTASSSSHITRNDCFILGACFHKM